MLSEVRLLESIQNLVRRKYVLSEFAHLADQPRIPDEQFGSIAKDVKGIVIFWTTDALKNWTAIFTTREVIARGRGNSVSVVKYALISDWQVESPFGVGGLESVLRVTVRDGRTLELCSSEFTTLSVWVAILQRCTKFARQE